MDAHRILLLAAFALTACTGEIADPANVGEDLPRPSPPIDEPLPPGFCDDRPPELADVATRRLSHVEYQNTIDDLLLEPTYADPGFPGETTEHGFENFVVNTSSIQDTLVETYALTAFRAAAAITETPADIQRVFGCDAWATPEEQDACVETLLSDFGTRAHRRPLSDVQRGEYRALITEVTADIDFEAALELTVAAMLQAPQLTYRIENTGGERVDSWEAASRLSYFLWQSMPDDVLFDAAAADELQTPEQLAEQARRMLAMPRAQEAMTDFHRQWFAFDQMYESTYNQKSPDLFPEWDEELQSAIREETVRFVEHVMSQDDATMENLFLDRTSFVNAPLAEHYGLPDVTDWTEVQLPEGERAGLLTRANFLAGRGNVGRLSPIKTGVFIIERVLCSHIGSPPDDAPTDLPDEMEGAPPRTERERYEDLTSPTECQNCHARINPVGFAFQSYTSTGAFRTEDNGIPVDATGELLMVDTDNPGVFDDAIGLSEQLADSNRVLDCAAQTWAAYSLGRRLEEEDACYLDRIRQSFRESGGNVRDLMLTIATSPEFLMGAAR